MPDPAGLTPPCVNLPRVHELADGALDLTVTRRLNEHMIECVSCAEEYQFVTELRDAAGSLPRVVPGDHVWESIAASLSTNVQRGHDDDAGDDVDGPAAAIVLESRNRRKTWTVGRAVAASVPFLAAGALAASMVRDIAVDRTPPLADDEGRSVVSQTQVAPASQTTPERIARALPANTQNPAPVRERTTTTHENGETIVRESAATVVARNEPSTAGPMQATTRRTTRSTLPAEFLLQYAGHDPLEQARPRSSEVDRELLAQAEDAILRCTAALQENPDDPRIRAALARAYQQKIAALRSLTASLNQYAGRPRSGVSVAPAKAEIPTAIGTPP